MMKKRLFTLFLALTVLGSLVIGALPAMATEGAITLRVHYFREDGDYDGCRLYLWDNAAVPCTNFDTPYQFEEIDGEMICEVKVNAGTSEIGYIVRWYPITVCIEASEDEFIDIEGIMAGTVDVYIKNSVEGCEIVLGDDVVKGSLILSAVYKEKNRDGSPQVIVQLSSELDSEPALDTFAVSGNEGEVTISAVKRVNTYYYLTLLEGLDIQGSYTVAVADKVSDVLMPVPPKEEEIEPKPTTTAFDEKEKPTANTETVDVPSQPEEVPGGDEVPHHRSEFERGLGSVEGVLPWIIMVAMGVASLVVSVVFIRKKR